MSQEQSPDAIVQDQLASENGMGLNDLTDLRSYLDVTSFVTAYRLREKVRKCIRNLDVLEALAREKSRKQAIAAYLRVHTSDRDILGQAASLGLPVSIATKYDATVAENGDEGGIWYVQVRVAGRTCNAGSIAVQPIDKIQSSTGCTRQEMVDARCWLDCLLNSLAPRYNVKVEQCREQELELQLLQRPNLSDELMGTAQRIWHKVLPEFYAKVPEGIRQGA